MLLIWWWFELVSFMLKPIRKKTALEQLQLNLKKKETLKKASSASVWSFSKRADEEKFCCLCLWTVSFTFPASCSIANHHSSIVLQVLQRKMWKWQSSSFVCLISRRGHSRWWWWWRDASCWRASLTTGYAAKNVKCSVFSAPDHQHQLVNILQQLSDTQP